MGPTIASMVTKLARQPNHTARNPPSTGEAMGAMPMMMLMSDNCRPARAPSYMSRTMARAMMIGPAPPIPCSMRASVSPSIESANALASVPMR